MILDKISTDTAIRAKATKQNDEKIEVEIGFLEYNREFYIFINSKQHKIILEQSKLNDIDLYLNKRGYTAIVRILKQNHSELELDILFFNSEIERFPEPIHIRLDDKIFKDIKSKKILDKRNDKEIAQALVDKVSFKINGDRYFISTSKNTESSEIFRDEIKSLENNLQKLNENQDKDVCKKEMQQELDDLYQYKKLISFCIYGDGFYLPIKNISTNEISTFLSATKLITLKGQIKKSTFRLIKSDIIFDDNSNDTIMAQKLENFRKDDGGEYLQTWNKYLDQEIKFLIQKAQDIGQIVVENTKRTTDGYELRTSKNQELEEGDYVCVSRILPVYLENKNITLDEYLASLQQQVNMQQSTDSYRISRVDRNFITIQTDKDIEVTNFTNQKVYLSIYGDETQLRRKLIARQRLFEGKSANPGLIDIISNKPLDGVSGLSISKINPLVPLTDFVKNKIFKNEPTQNQKDAIGIALNTPDIAIIQGPPGTGKTTVLTAILERLNEEADKTVDKKGSVLVTALQHDAVENIIERLSINGLPTPKFGKRSGGDIDEDFYSRIEIFKNEIIKNATEHSPILANTPSINNLERYFEAYIKTPSNKFAKDLINFIINEISGKLNSEILKKAKEILLKISEDNIFDIKDLGCIYALRTTKNGFLDDGLERNKDCLYSKFKIFLNEEEKNILEQKDIKNLDEYLQNLLRLKIRLLNTAYPKPIFRAKKPREDIVELKDITIEYLKNSGTTKDKINSILSDYINELECNPFELKKIIESYSFVFSSTTGQSIKTINQKAAQGNEDFSYDVVVIDEAARITPLDLLGVMVLAKQKMILVGDHRQLPHMIDDKIVKSADLKENEYIKNSMFGYLKARAIELEKRDGIKRSITLNNQYRTHPMLGNFISDNFYKEFDENFNSPLKDDFFKQNLKGIELTPAVWADVGSEKGKELKAWSRSCEVDKIIELLREWINSDEGKNLSFGIITFYAKQVELIEKRIYENFSKDEINDLLDNHRLKWGTVDSFQGMEFDIVFLSVVRSRSLFDIKQDTKHHELFGFLISKNRLCVSMSRQKKALIVVGDASYYQSNIAKEGVPALYNFLYLCKNEGRII